MDNQLTKRIKNLNDCLIFLVENPEFWETDSHHNRQKAFNFTNNYYAHQLNDSFDKLIDVYNIVLNDANLNLKTIEKQYKAFNVEQSKNLQINNSKILLDITKKHIKTLQEHYKDIGEVLARPIVINQHEYGKMKSLLLTKITDINDEVIKSTNDVLSLVVYTSDIRDEVELIELRHNSGDIQYKSGIRNFVAKFNKPKNGYKR